IHLIACIMNKSVTNNQAYRFLDDLGAALMKKYTPTQLNVSTAPMCLESFSPTLQDFIKRFNETEDYEDKAKEVFNKFNEVKEVLIDDMEKLLERGGNLDEALIKVRLRFTIPPLNLFYIILLLLLIIL